MKYLKMIIGNMFLFSVVLPLAFVINGLLYLWAGLCYIIDHSIDTLLDWSNGE